MFLIKRIFHLLVLEYIALGTNSFSAGFSAPKSSHRSSFPASTVSFSSSSHSSSPFASSHLYLTNGDDNSFEEYSRCLTPQQELDQINSELALSKTSTLKRLRRKFMRWIEQGREVQPGTLILVRGGESEFSKNYTFTGWADPDITQDGILQMEHCSRLLYESGYADIIDTVYTSRLKRAIKSAWIIVQEISAPFLPVYKSWRLNERHYGRLTGLCKREAAKTLGSDVVQAWRRSLKARPPPVKVDDHYYPGNDSKYADLLPEQIPRSESLENCMSRTRPLWEYKISRDLKRGQNVMVVAHANTLRGLAKIIDNIGDDEISQISFPKGIPFVYKFDSNLSTIKPEDDSLTQIHTNGSFLEKPGLLEKAMKSQRHWEENIPGLPAEDDLPSVAKRVTTLEDALLTLKKEKEWAMANDTTTSTTMDYKEMQEVQNNDGPVILTNGDDYTSIDDINDEDERFEEGRDTTSATNEIVVNWSNAAVDSKDPIIVFVRHGRTPHNKLALFTGWADPPLAVEGVEDARTAGKLLKKHGFEFDVVYSSWLYRAIQTAWFILEEMDLMWLPLIKSWRLNERHYGDLTGKSKKMVANIYGEKQLKMWRRGFDVPPPPVSSYSFDYPGNDKRRTKYVSDIRISLTETISRSIESRKLSIHRKFPKSESLKMTMARSIPFYTQKIIPEAVAKNKRVLITSHENAIRGILMELCEIPEENMNDLHLPNGVPLIYNVRRKCISLLDDGSGEDPLEKYDFGSAAKYLFRPCEIDEDEDWYEVGQQMKQKQKQVQEQEQAMIS
eukprot:CAMPEP_0203662630 /NCGR_PEP_ID=MMETSP0090-20130426/529_1 /ASSEMBLY_ACC=CAM_ASM_001088 /TAXON_ID=426623 /ORGANISM="Chaetoceros affinis, Strain CCMP159" /LENGTH=786 /DNA_ID=CAMNT_0050525445 /DNA_START=40 /DNA_END=2400 /DNA_ORIENTATION=-